jgi:sigma-E factor negative regulatory protein RseA
MTLNSSDQLFESLSALVDNEANELEVRRILKHAENNPDLMERWRRYHLIGSALRKERSLQISGPTKLMESVASYIDSSSLQIQEQEKDIRSGAGSSWRDLMGKSAVAASFAATLVLGFNLLSSKSSDPMAESSLMASAPSTAVGGTPVATAQHTPIGFELPLPEARTVSTASSGTVPTISTVSQSLNQMDDITDPATQQFLNQLLIQHAERASSHGSLGIMPFARVSRMNAESLR